MSRRVLGNFRGCAAGLAAALAAIMVLLSQGWALGATTAGGFEAETMSLASGSGGGFADSAASGGSALLIHSNAAASRGVTAPNAGRLVVRARGDRCDGAPRMVVRVGATRVLSRLVTARTWTNHAVGIAPLPGAQTVRISFTNDRRTNRCDRNLHVDKVSFGAAPAPEPVPSPTPASDVFEGTRLYVDPSSDARRQADA